MIRSSLDTVMAGSSSGSGATRELVWPYPGEPRKAWFILRDEEEVKLWHLLRERGLSMESDLVHQAMTLNLPCIAEVSFLPS